MWNMYGSTKALVSIKLFRDDNCLASFRDRDGTLFVEPLNLREVREEFENSLEITHDIKAIIEEMERSESESEEKCTIECIEGTEMPDWEDEDKCVEFVDRLGRIVDRTDEDARRRPSRETNGTGT